MNTLNQTTPPTNLIYVTQISNTTLLNLAETRLFDSFTEKLLGVETELVWKTQDELEWVIYVYHRNHSR